MSTEAHTAGVTPPRYRSEQVSSSSWLLGTTLSYLPRPQSPLLALSKNLPLILEVLCRRCRIFKLRHLVLSAAFMTCLEITQLLAPYVRRTPSSQPSKPVLRGRGKPLSPSPVPTERSRETSYPAWTYSIHSTFPTSYCQDQALPCSPSLKEPMGAGYRSGHQQQHYKCRSFPGSRHKPHISQMG